MNTAQVIGRGGARQADCTIVTTTISISEVSTVGEFVFTLKLATCGCKLAAGSPRFN